MGNDIKILNKNENYWVLIHPSNTEPVIRIIAESKNKQESLTLVQKYRNILQTIS
jgi:phosphomannomutase